MAVFSLVVLMLSLAALSVAHPVLSDNSKRLSLADVDGPRDVPLEDVSKLLDRYVRQISSGGKAPNARWSPLHRAVLQGALKVAKQLLNYEEWTPGHLELLKAEQETLIDLVADEKEEQEDSRNGIENGEKIPPIPGNGDVNVAVPDPAIVNDGGTPPVENV